MYKEADLARIREMQELSDMTKEEAESRLREVYETIKKRLADPNDNFSDVKKLYRRLYEDDVWLARKHNFNTLAGRLIDFAEEIKIRTGIEIILPEVIRR